MTRNSMVHAMLCLVWTAMLATSIAAEAAPDPAALDSGIADLGLRPYPHSVEVKHYSNPMEIGALPISVPDRDNKASSERVSRWRLPYEARVLLMQYKHSFDDSPLLIARYYAGQLQQLGFELLTICEMPCLSASGLADDAIYWSKLLDPGHRLEIRPFGDRGIYFIAHRPDAVVAVRVGAWDGGFGSAVKILQAPAIDRTPITQYIESQRAVVTSAPLPRPPGAAAGGKGKGAVETVAPKDLEARIKSHKGTMVVQLSSLDRNCGPCLSANAEFRDVQRQVGDQIKLVQTVWPAPWSTPPVEIQAFMRKHQINALPSRLAFENGELVGKQIGWTPGDKGGDALLKPGTAGADVRPAAAAAPVQIVSARDATEVVARSKGYLVVQVSSFDTRCSFCGPSNDAFDALSRRPDAKGTKFVRVTYQPWTSMSQDAFAQSYGVNGLPTFFTMKDGQLVRRQNGIAQPDELHRLLLEGLD